jgi:hypothetical protein
MLALLSSPVRRWLLVTLLVPLIALVLRRLGRFIEHRHDDRPTRLSRVLLKASAALERLRRRGDRTDGNDTVSARRSA